MHLKLITFTTELCTVGKLYQSFDDCVQVDQQLCVTMEKPWLDNKNDVSCVPAGEYDLIHRVSPSQGETFYLSNTGLGVTLSDTGTRTYIQLDVANVQSQLLGCIAVGEGFNIYLDQWAITRSSQTKRKLMSILGKESHTLEIIRY